MDTVEDLKEREAKLQQELADIKARREMIQALPDDKMLAVELHSLTCMHNHTDGCGWYYEISNHTHNWNGWTHKRALAQAHAALAVMDDPYLVIDLLKAIKGAK